MLAIAVELRWTRVSADFVNAKIQLTVRARSCQFMVEIEIWLQCLPQHSATFRTFSFAPVGACSYKTLSGRQGRCPSFGFCHIENVKNCEIGAGGGITATVESNAGMCMELHLCIVISGLLHLCLHMSIFPPFVSVCTDEECHKPRRSYPVAYCYYSHTFTPCRKKLL